MVEFVTGELPWPEAGFAKTMQETEEVRLRDRKSVKI
jgi:hypothetical protein